ncbi:unnamed protein product [Cyprideis torosa]|uniref:Uncharacterized protein n=1 Tax=Cyprideis torosa TaxID=163714 RepID=A0A7R8ZMT8_9CRUS|nr:unnamed protein product [Cyprideis torosa]CAG0886329.1 unnamed protein product [Cyprideis torosa]
MDLIRGRRSAYRENLLNPFIAGLAAVTMATEAKDDTAGMIAGFFCGALAVSTLFLLVNRLLLSSSDGKGTAGDCPK